ncbi:MAG: hypothetical protein HQM14_11745 [SAR324 cluster bacterium]|nr:hypothetical protein [SAR324 cluster bacterium]
MYQMRADLEKNRLYILFQDDVDVEYIEEFLDELDTEVQKLEPGFSVINNLLEAGRLGMGIDQALIPSMRILISRGVKKVIRVIADSDQGRNLALRFDRKSVVAGFTGTMVYSVEDAEKILDDLEKTARENFGLYVDSSKNRLYVIYMKTMTTEQVRWLTKEIKVVLKRLNPGFDMVVNLQEVEFFEKEAIDELTPIMKLIKANGLRAAVRVIHQQSMSDERRAILFDQKSNQAGYLSKVAYSLEEADQILSDANLPSVSEIHSL